MNVTHPTIQKPAAGQADHPEVIRARILFDANTQVSKFYVPGAYAYYAKFPDNPWRAAEEKVEKVFLSSLDAGVLTAAAEAFVRTCSDLVDQFKRMSKPPRPLTVGDAFYAGGEDRLSKWNSTREKECWRCGTRTALQMAMDPGDGKTVVLTCAACRPALNQRQARRA
jgi:hypothetical protein